MIFMERTEKESIYFSIQELVCHYLDLNKEEIMISLVNDLIYLEKNRLENDYYEAYNFLRNLLWYLNSDGSTEPATLLGNIYSPIEINFMDVLKRIYKAYKS